MGAQMKKVTEAHTKPQRAKSLDDDIAALRDKLVKLEAKKKERERQELERNQKAIAVVLRNAKLDAVPVEKWSAALLALRNLLCTNEADSAQQPAPIEHYLPARSSQEAAQPAMLPDACDRKRAPDSARLGTGSSDPNADSSVMRSAASTPEPTKTVPSAAHG